MSQPRPGLLVTTRLVARRRLRFGALLIAALLAGLIPLLLIQIHASAVAAVRQSAAGAIAGRHFVIQPRSSQLNIPARIPEVVGTQSLSALAGTTTGLVKIQLTRAQSEIPLQTLVAGGIPRTQGEVLFSRYVADLTGARLGERVVVTVDGKSASPVLVGISVNPADARDAFALEISPGLTLAESDQWLTDQDPSSIGVLAPLLDSTQEIDYRQLNSIDAANVAMLPSAIKALGWLGHWGIVAFNIMLAFLLVGLYRPTRRDAETLVTAGLSPARTWAAIVTGIMAVMGIGAAVGTVVSSVGLRLARTRLGAVLGQDWTRVDLSLPAGVTAIVVPILVGGSLYLIARVRWANVTTVSRLRLPTLPRWAGVVSSAAIVAGAAVLAISPTGILGHNTIGFAVAAVAVVALCAVSGLNRLGLIGAPRATRAIVIFYHQTLTSVLTIAMVIAVSVASYSALTMGGVRLSQAVTSRTLQPGGSLLVLDIGRNQATQVIATYRQLGGHGGRSFDIPSEDTHIHRVTSTGLIACIRQHPTAPVGSLPESCYPHNTLSAINTILIDPAAGTRQTADPGLIDSAGTVGILVFPNSSDDSIDSVSTTPATPDENLGGNMPGLVVGPSSPVARSLGLRPSGLVLLDLPAMNALTEANQARVRAQVIRLAPTAQISEGNIEPYSAERALATGVAVAGAGVVAILILLVLASLADASRDLRTMTARLGAPGTYRARIGLRIYAPTILAALVSTASVLAFARVLLGSNANPGWAWYLPLVVLMGAALLSALSLSTAKGLGVGL